MPQLFFTCALILQACALILPGAMAADDQCQQEDSCHDIVSSQTVSLIQKKMGMSKTTSSESSEASFWDFIKDDNIKEKEDKDVQVSPQTVPAWSVAVYQGKIALMNGAGCTAPYKPVPNAPFCSWMYNAISGQTSWLHHKAPPIGIEHINDWPTQHVPIQNWAKGCSYNTENNVLLYADKDPLPTKMDRSECATQGLIERGCAKIVPNPLAFDGNPSFCFCTLDNGKSCPDAP